MEKVNPREQKNLIVELSQGREMTNELKKQLDPLTSPENCEALIEKILSTYDKALAMLTCKGFKEETSPGIGMKAESPQSHYPVPNSPLSEASNGFSRNHQRYKKRKTLLKWSEKVRVCSPEGAVDDGHSWRKYGQKDILGSNFPRAYYRCTHRNSRGCLAIKQVQRSDEDPSIFELTYKGRHTCVQTANYSGSTTILDGKEMPKAKKARSLGKEQQGLQVETEILRTKKEIFRSFSFSFTGVDSENLGSQFFPDDIKETDMMGSCSPAFLSPTTSESNYFSSSCRIDSNFGIDKLLQTSDSDLTDLISTPTSVISNSPFGDLHFSMDQVDFDPSFTLDDTLAYFS